MKKLVGLLLVLAFPLICFAQGEFKLKVDNETIDFRLLEPSERAFFELYREVVNSDDLQRLKQIVCSKCLEAINDNNKEFFEDIFKQHLDRKIPDEAKVQIKEIDAKTTLSLFSEQFEYPQLPTHWMQIDWSKNEYSSVTMILELVNLDNQWCLVIPIPKEATLVAYRKVKEEKVKFQEEVHVRFKQLSDPLLSELKALLKESRKLEAVKRYAEYEGVSLSMSKSVIELLMESLNQKE